ncbi:hypothetical protein AAG906_007916 [Vitis piasezkii]
MATEPPAPPSAFFFIILVTVFALTPIAHSIPFIVLHGIGDKCSNRGITHFTELLGNWSSSQGYCIEIGDGTWDSWVLPLLEQILAVLCQMKRECSITFLMEGKHFILNGKTTESIKSYLICLFSISEKQVKNFISLGGPHAGTASASTLWSKFFFSLFIMCTLCSGFICILVDNLIKSGIYSDYVQEHLAPSGYLKIPTDIISYLEGCRFLPKLNNEIIDKRNSTYKERFSSLQNLVLIMFEHDTILIPKETAWFGYYPDGSFSWFCQQMSVPGNHLAISRSDMKTYMVPYLEDQASAQPVIKDSSSHRGSSSIQNFVVELVGLTKNRPLLLTVD